MKLRHIILILCLHAGVLLAAEFDFGDFSYTSNPEGDGLMITGYRGIENTISIPSDIDGYAVTHIDSYFFRSRNAVSITLPDTVTNIEGYAFFGLRNLTNIILSTNIKEIGASAFFGCESLRSIELPETVLSIGREAFFGCELIGAMRIPKSIEFIEDRTFYGCTGLTNLHIPDGVEIIGRQAFGNCTNLNYLTIPSSVTNIGIRAFDRCVNLTGVYFEGDPPEISTLGHGLPLLIYYTRGATGWESTYVDYPTVLWNPSFIINSHFGLFGSNFHSIVIGQTNQLVKIECSNSLDEGDWTSCLTTNFSNVYFEFTDPINQNALNRFYRLSMP